MEILKIGIGISETPGPAGRGLLLDGPHRLVGKKVDEVFANTAFADFGKDVVRCGEFQIDCAVSDLGGGNRVDLTLRRPNGHETETFPQFLWMQLSANPTVVLEHGWQSWSVVRPVGVKDVTPIRRLLPQWIRDTYQVDPSMAGKVVYGDQFLLMLGYNQGSKNDGNLTQGAIAGFLDGKKHLSSIVATPKGVWAVAFLDGISLLQGEEYRLDPFWFAVGDPGKLYSQYVSLWGDVGQARINGSNPLGWCSWYYYFWTINQSRLLSNLSPAASCGIEVMLLDDGYERSLGDWEITNRRFPGGIRSIAKHISNHDLKPGLWTAPFLVSKSATIMQKHPDWLVRDSKNHPLKVLWNPLSKAWGGWVFALDTTNPAVVDHLKNTYSHLVEYGFPYHKIDFCYAAAMLGKRVGDGKFTRAQSLRAGFEALREGIGESSYLLGCGAPLAQAVGIVDAMRVSADTAPYWAPGIKHIPGYDQTAPAARNALMTSVLRAPLHRRLWVNDPDCLLLRKTKTRLNQSQRDLMKTVVSATGGLMFVSDNLNNYDSSEWESIERLRDINIKADAPCDLLDPFSFHLRLSSGLDLDLTSGFSLAQGGELNSGSGPESVSELGIELD